MAPGGQRWSVGSGRSPPRHMHTRTHTHTHTVLSSNRENKEIMRSSWERMLGQTYLKKGKFLIRLRDEIRLERDTQ